jgi:hypothetical protein
MQFRYQPILGLVAVLLVAQSSTAYADDPLETDPQPYHCEDSTVTEAGTYFKDDPNGGFYAIFQSTLGVQNFPKAHASVVDRSAGQNSPLAKQKVGDKVQVCLLHTPTKSPYCDPNKDERGRVYRIYNYRLRSAYQGWNGNHGCGGA